MRGHQSSFYDGCKYNGGIICYFQDECDHCGFNQSVSSSRLQGAEDPNNWVIKDGKHSLKIKKKEEITHENQVR